MSQVIIIRDEEQCKKVMDKLYANGIAFRGIEYRYSYMDVPCFREVNDRAIYFLSNEGSNVYDSLNYALKHGYSILTADQFLENPELIDGWEKVEQSIVITMSFNGKPVSPNVLSRKTWMDIYDNYDKD